VIAVQSGKSFRYNRYYAEPIRGMMQKGMTQLTGAPTWQDAWRQFFEPGDVVGIKVNASGHPICSSREAMAAILEGLYSAGIKPANVVVYDRYRTQFAKAGIAKWLPEGVRTMGASDNWQEVQEDINGYDSEHYIELPLIYPGRDPEALASRRSYAAEFITKQVNKVINLPILKDHDGAGVTLALKNLSHGLVNNVNRSHPTTDRMRFTEFIPHVVSMPVIRNKAVLHILDGVRGIFHGGPGLQNPAAAWDHCTLYFATDPVAMDMVGWSAVDAQRKRAGLQPVSLAKPDGFTSVLTRQPEYIIEAGKAGLGEADPMKIDLRRFKL
jgi:uncharacterized protein (DUF362 family)